MNPEQVVYAELADLYDQSNQPKHRDWFLVLAADSALAAGMTNEADRLLGRLLSLNPHHFLRPFGSFAEALRSPDVQGYVANLKRNYPPDRARQLLEAEQRKATGTLYPSPPPRSQPRPATPPVLFKPPEEPEEPEVIVARIRGTPPASEPPVPPPPAPAARPQPAPRPQPAAPPEPEPSAPRAMPRPYQVARPEPAAVEPYGLVPLRPRRSTTPPPESTGGSPFVPYLLFVVLLLLSLGVAVYTFVRPFLPSEWLP